MKTFDLRKIPGLCGCLASGGFDAIPVRVSAGKRLLRCALSLIFAAVVSAGDAWVWRNPVPQGNDLNAVAWANNRHVAVGRSGTILQSPGGCTWTVVANANPSDLLGVTYGNGMFVAVGAGGVILTSTDGAAWSPQVSGTANDLNAVAYSAGLFVTVGNAGTILISETGGIWDPAPSGTTENLRAVTSDDAEGFLAVGEAGVVVRSEDGFEWAAQTTRPEYWLYGVAYHAGRYVAVGQNTQPDVGEYVGLILVYENGVWSPRSSGTDYWLNAIIFDPASQRFVAAGAGGTIVNSATGSAWYASRSGTLEFFGLASGGGPLVAVGRAGMIQTADASLTWTSCNGPFLQLMTVTHNGTDFVVFGENGALLRSSDGAVWTSGSTGRNNALAGSAFGNGMLVAVGAGGMILVSTNGTAWTSPASGTSSDLTEVVWARDRFVAVGLGGTILTSQTGTSWTPQSSGQSSALYGIAANAARFVAVGEGGTILTSESGETWTRQTSGLSSSLLSVAFGHGLFAAVGTRGKILTSPDGLTWTPRTSGVTKELRGVAFSGSEFVAIGASGVTLVSDDGETWRALSGSAMPDLEAIVYGEGQFVAVGEAGTILTRPTAPPRLSPVIVSANTAQATAGQSFSYQILALNDPASFGAANLPLGLEMNAGTGLISGKATTYGEFDVTLSAMNAWGTGPMVLKLKVVRQTQTIAFDTLPNRLLCIPPFEVGATASSGLPVTFAVVSGPVTVAANQVTLTGVGRVCILASQAGNNLWSPAAGVERCFDVAKEPQQITSFTLRDRYRDESPFTLVATASSGLLPVTFRTVAGPAVVEGNHCTLTGTGDVTIEAAQAGDACSAPSATQRTFRVSKRSQTVTFPALPPKFLRSPPFKLPATASSGLVPSLAQVSGAPSLGGDVFTPNSEGPMTIRASQPGNDFYLPAAEVDRSFYVVGTNYYRIQSPTTASLRGAAYGNGRFVVPVPNQGVLVSEDGLTWSNVPVSDFNVYDRIAFGDGWFMSVVYDRELVPPYRWLASRDGASWSKVCDLNMGQTRLGFADGEFIGTGADGAYSYGVSFKDGQWHFRATRHAPPIFDGSTGYAYGNGIRLMTGFIWEPAAHGKVFRASPSLLDWVQVSAPTGDNWSVWQGSLVYGDGKFVTTIVSQRIGSIAVSGDNGVSWRMYPATSDDNNIYLVSTYTGRQFVVPSGKSMIFSSATGDQWQTNVIFGGTSANLYAAAYGDRKTLVVGDGGTILLSYEPLDCSPVVTSPTNATAFVGVPFRYQITAECDPTAFGATNLPSFLTLDSASGLITGTPDNSGVCEFSVSATNDIGSGAQSVQLEVVEEVVLMNSRVSTEGAFEFELLGKAGHTYDIEWSADLKTWTTLTTVTLTGTTALVTDSVVEGPTARYYRALAQ